MKNLLFISFLLFPIFSKSQGLLLDTNSRKEYQTIPKKYSSHAIDKSQIPQSIDHSKYLPTIINQKEFGTCVGMAAAYYMRTALEAKSLNITDKEKIDQLSYSPSYLYNAIKSSANTECYNATNPLRALEFMKNKGIARFSEQGYPYCGNNIESIKLKASSRIMDYVKVFGFINRTDNVNNLTKKALAEGSPLLALILTDDAFINLKFINSWWYRLLNFFGISPSEKNDFRLWRPDDKQFGEAHAICIVGYDDTKYDVGAFKVANSWGETYGEDGYFWIKYTDYPNVVLYCYQAYIQSINPAETELAAELKIKFADFTVENEVDFTKNESNKLETYQFKEWQEDSTAYNVEANIEKQAYLYLIGKNEHHPEITLLFPNSDSSSTFMAGNTKYLKDSSSALMGANTKFLLPSPIYDKKIDSLLNRHLNLTGHLGKENWLFLFSTEKLNIQDYITKLKQKKGSFSENVLDTFGGKLVPKNQIAYNKHKIGFTLSKNHKGTIVPILVNFTHIEKEKGSFLF